MNAVFYYSNTDQSKTVAEYIANALGWDIFNIEDGDGEGLEYEKAFVVFPVHCQNIPARVKSFLSNLLARYLIPVATYGRMHHGNVLYEIENDYGFTVIGGAFVPAKHTYIEEEGVSSADLWALEPLIEKARYLFCVRKRTFLQIWLPSGEAASEYLFAAQRTVRAAFCARRYVRAGREGRGLLQRSAYAALNA